MQIEVHIVNAFVDGESGGNPAGVVIDADALSAQQKRSIAAQVGLSETAFVSRSKIATLKVEFFTPTRQIAHCGHATVATFALCHQLGMLADGSHTKESIEGIVEVDLRSGMVFMKQRAPTCTHLERGDIMNAILESIGLNEEDILPHAAPCIARAGNAFLLIPLANRQALAKIRPDCPAIEAVSSALDLIGYYPFSVEAMREGRSATARMFAPAYGIAEESATGTAAGPLACYLHDVFGSGARSHLIEQGWFMNPPSPSVINVELDFDGGKVSCAITGGSARLVRVLHIEA